MVFLSTCVSSFSLTLFLCSATSLLPGINVRTSNDFVTLVFFLLDQFFLAIHLLHYLTKGRFFVEIQVLFPLKRKRKLRTGQMSGSSFPEINFNVKHLIQMCTLSFNFYFYQSNLKDIYFASAFHIFTSSAQ